jgi:hypothetical protein
VYTRLTCGLAAAGWRVSLIAPELGTVPAMPPNAVYYPVEYLRGYRARIGGTGRIVARLNDLQPDLALFVDPELFPAMLRWKHRSGRPVVFDRHEYFERADVLVSRGLRGRVLAWGYGRYEHWAAPRLDGVVVVLEDMVRSLPPGTRVCVAHNYPARDALETLAQPPSPETPRYTSILLGTQEIVRGCREMLALAHELVVKRKRNEFTILLGGRWQAGLLEEARQFVAEHGLEANVTFAERYLPHAQVLELVRASRIGLCPYLNNPKAESQLMNKLPEFMAAGLPVITSPSSMNGEIVAASGGGVLLWADEVTAIADTVEHWLDQPDEAAALGARGQAYVTEHLVWEKELERLDAWLRQRLNSKLT